MIVHGAGFGLEPDPSDYVMYLLFTHPQLDPSLVDPKWFTDPEHDMFDAILKHRFEYNGKDIYLFDKATGSKLTELFARIEKTLPTPEMYERYVGALKADHYVRNVWAFMQKWETEWKETLDAKLVIKGLTEFVDRMREKETPAETVHLPEIYAPVYVEELENRRDIKDPELMTGYKKLDDEMWGLGRGELISIGALSGVGKSVFSLNIVVNLIKNGKKVVFFSTEMSAFEQWNRANIINTGIEAYRFRSANFNDDEWKRVIDVCAWLQEQNNFIVDAAASPTIEHIESVVSRYQPDVAVVDYLQRCTYAKAERHDLAVGEMMKKLKTLSRTQNCAMIVNSQLNRGAAGGDAGLNHFSDSAKIVHESDFAILLEEEEPVGGVYSNVLYCKIAKGRHSQKGTLKLYFDKNVLRIRPMEVI